MKPVYADVRIELELNGPGNGWTDATRDVRIDTPIKAQYGIQGTGPNDRVASTGTLTFALNNAENNSARRVGFYSPNHPGVRPGFRIGIGARLSIGYAGTRYFKSRGTLDQIQPIPGIYGDKRVLCTAVDWMDEAARARITGIPTQVGKRSDEVFRTLLAAVPRQPAAKLIGIAQETYAYALDNARDENMTALSEFQRLALSELGLVYVKGDTSQGGTLVFEDRRKRGTAHQNAIVLDGSRIAVLSATRARGDIINKVQVIAHPRRVDPAPVVLYSLESKPQVEAAATLTLLGTYRDPAQRAARVGGVDLQPLVAGVDYRMNAAADGTGADLTANFAITPHFGGNGVRFDIRNNGTVPGFVVKLQARGRGVYDFDTAMLEADDSESRDQYGLNVATLDMFYQSSVEVAQNAARYILGLYKDPLTVVERVGFVANASGTLMRAALSLEVSDRVGIRETVTGLSDQIPGASATRGYFINAVDLTIEAGSVIRCAWELAPADNNQYWILGTGGASELGGTTRLSNGLFTPFWVLSDARLAVATRLSG